ncbi:hypothetical protein HU200_022687 [Digitaria exilis]|uniref:Uncharacterized protein n=1 Tax=Digitaria exilis TaxID=1010633 RepID=A0A835CCN9_9POAL|nr:hypothetical protein HU200_022687 [Digitaria exilis]
MDHVLRLHVEHEHHTAARLGKGGVDASRAVLALAAVALFLAATGSLATTKAALFVLSNAIILALLAADCRCFFFAAGASATSDAIDACEQQPAASGHVLEKQGRHNQQCAVQPRASCPGYLLQHGNKNRCAASETSTGPAMALASDGKTTLQALEEQEDVPPASRPELLLGLPDDEGESIALELEAPAVVQEPTCKTVVPGLDELGIDELNKKFDEFIQSRRNKWMKEEAYLQLQS